ncbi:MAG: ATP synthase F0 subunit B [Pseudomonadota bacterium]
MTASNWVYLSTLVFLALVFFKSRKAIIAFLDAKRDEIQKNLTETKHKRMEAEALYEEYRIKMEALEQQTQIIIDNAEKTAAEMLKKAEEDIEALKTSKKNEVQRRIADYERSVKDKLTAKYAHIFYELFQDEARGMVSQKEIDFKSIKSLT